MAAVRRLLAIAGFLAMLLMGVGLAASGEPAGEGQLDQLTGPISAAYTATITEVSRADDACNAIFVATYETNTVLRGSAPASVERRTLTALVPLLKPLCPRLPNAVETAAAVSPFTAGAKLVVVHTEEWGKLWFATDRLEAIKRVLSRAGEAPASS